MRRWRGEGYEPRHYRVVRLVVGDAAAWIVASSSLRDDNTWDVIAKFLSRDQAMAYVDDVLSRNRELAQMAGCSA